jgi:hypothetical protein
VAVDPADSAAALAGPGAAQADLDLVMMGLLARVRDPADLADPVECMVHLRNR